ncbi:MAG: hypothetical protein HY791_12460 [Deltaproteobacteria bacterium]|nr:hypothetical protein [Deltaproteobacteria bacterium]
MSARFLSLASLLFACGETALVDPDADLRAALRIVRATRLSLEGDPHDYVFARLAGDAALRLPVTLSLSTPAGRIAAPTENVRWAPCGAQACAWLTTAPSGEFELIAERPELDFSDRRALEDLALGPYSLDAGAIESNSRAGGVLGDPASEWLIDQDAPELGREWEVIASEGPCNEIPGPSDDGWSLAPPSFSIIVSFDAEGLACVSLRPRLPRASRAILWRTISASAVAARYDATFTPPVTAEPILYATLFDLELPQRCSNVVTSVQRAVARVAAQISQRDAAHPKVIDLGTFDIGTPGELCRQSNAPFDDRAVARTILARLAQELEPSRRGQVVLIYVNNLDLSPSFEKVLSMNFLASRLEGLSTDPGPPVAEHDRPEVDAHVVAIAEPSPAQAIGGELTVAFGSTEDPSFEPAILAGFGTFWPFRTSTHDPSIVIPLRTSPERPISYFTVCQSESFIEPVGDPAGLVFRALPELGPAFRTSVPDQIGIPNHSFVATTVRLTWEGCEAFCDRPVQGRPDGPAWLEGLACSLE